MHCEQKHLLKQLAVNDPHALESEPWKAHLRDCSQCMAEKRVMSESLALFKQFESDRLAQCPAHMCWEKFSGLLSQQQRRRKILNTLKMPLAAAVSGFILLGGMAGYLYNDFSSAPSVNSMVNGNSADRINQLRGTISQAGNIRIPRRDREPANDSFGTVPSTVSHQQKESWVSNQIINSANLTRLLENSLSASPDFPTSLSIKPGSNPLLPYQNAVGGVAPNQYVPVDYSIQNRSGFQP